MPTGKHTPEATLLNVLIAQGAHVGLFSALYLPSGQLKQAALEELPKYRLYLPVPQNTHALMEVLGDRSTSQGGKCL